MDAAQSPLITRSARRPWLLAIVAAASVVALSIVAGCGPAPVAPPASTVPQRIISLVPAVTEMLFAIGAGPTVVAVSSFDRFPPEATQLPTVGALLDPDVERVLSLRPDLVVIHDSQVELAQRLRRASIDSVAFPDSTLSDVFSTLDALGERTNRREDAARVAGELTSAFDEVRRIASGRRPLRVALIFGREPGALRAIYASGGRGFLHELLAMVGGVNVFADVDQDGFQASIEQILDRRPEVIIELLPSRAASADTLAAERAVWQTLSSLPAVRTGRIHGLADSSLSIPGPRLGTTARRFAAALHGAP